MNEIKELLKGKKHDLPLFKHEPLETEKPSIREKALDWLSSTFHQWIDAMIDNYKFKNLNETANRIHE